MDDFSTRLEEILDYLNIKPVTLAEEMGVQRTSFNHLLSGRNKPGFEFLYKLHACYPIINLNWLISGTGSMIENSDVKIRSTENKPLKTQVNTDLFSNIFMNPALETNKKTDPVEPSVQVPNTFTSDEKPIKRLIIVYEDGQIIELKP